jgi:hypothetical protein
VHGRYSTRGAYRTYGAIALMRHADCDVADAGPGVEPCPERPESPVVRRSGEPGEAECCSQESGALIEHALLDDLVRPQQQCLRDGQPERLRRLEIDDELELGRLLYWKRGRLFAS